MCIWRSRLSVFEEFSVGVDDDVVVVTAALLTVTKLTEITMQLVLGALISKSSFMSFLRDVNNKD